MNEAILEVNSHSRQRLLRRAGCFFGVTGDLIGGPLQLFRCRRRFRNVFRQLRGRCCDSFRRLLLLGQGARILALLLCFALNCLGMMGGSLFDFLSARPDECHDGYLLVLSSE